MTNEEKDLKKVYYTPGDVVKVRQPIQNVPEMVVKSVQKTTYLDKEKGILFGIMCFWFDRHMSYHEKLFNTKDLEKVD